MRWWSKWVIGSALLWVVFASIASAGQERRFRLIVNRENPISALEREQVESLFLKKSSRFARGGHAEPVDLFQDSSTRENFTRLVHKRSVEAVCWHWRRMAFNSAITQPMELDNERQVLAFVAANPGAIGYVSTSTSLDGYSVKEVEIEDLGEGD